MHWYKLRKLNSKSPANPDEVSLAIATASSSVLNLRNHPDQIINSIILLKSNLNLDRDAFLRSKLIPFQL